MIRAILLANHRGHIQKIRPIREDLEADLSSQKKFK
jgi:hypothetical protein